MIYNAHSPKGDIPGQSYAEHIENTYKRAVNHADAICLHAHIDGEALCSVVRCSALFHDLGKLYDKNQEALSSESDIRKLPVNHVDAGVARCLDDKNISSMAAAVIHAHHRGLADFPHESNQQSCMFRDNDIMAETDRALSNLAKKHEELVDIKDYISNDTFPQGDYSVFYRLALSCLADADHEDTSIHYRKICETPELIPLNPQKRLEKLDKYVDGLGKDNSRRTQLRNEMYTSCRNSDITANIASCDSPVGSGKTTAVMAHLLTQALSRGLRRIFVVLPFTNIITQSVKIYREALVLPGENCEEVVAELHHRADFESQDIRHFTALWRAPIIVTTAVAFFETLASNSTSTLRRLHQLPGSAVFVDESHAALPADLLPISWKWINTYANDWGCYWLLASGSLNRFWTINEIAKESSADVPEIVSAELRDSLSQYEQNRIIYKHDLSPKSLEDFSEWIHTFPGPRLVILNTVQNAAVLADFLCEKYSRDAVEHLSSALIPIDRSKKLEEIQKRLKNTEDTDWTLVATSCVEAGVNLSFRNGFRETASVVSLLQTAGRINREGIFENCEVWSFELEKNSMFNDNPGLKNSSKVLREYLRNGINITPELSTKSINKELTECGFPNRASHKKDEKKYELLVNYEASCRFPLVEKEFRVIENNSEIAVVDSEIAKKVQYGTISWQELQNNSVQIAKYVLEEMHTQTISDGVYYWDLGYDDFLGYMAGVLPIIKSRTKQSYKGKYIR